VWSQLNTPIGRMSYYAQDTQTTCNVACGVMILKAVKGTPIDESTLIGQIKKNVDPARSRLAPSGYTLEQVVSALAYGPWKMSLGTQRASPQVLRMASQNRPAIASVENRSFAHAVLVVGNTGDDFVILDPQFGLRVIPFQTFPQYPVEKPVLLLRFGDKVVTSW
jgi:ABC-type bacteriocin/lantibiotic exporter with double-glycine peptidase domain